MIYMIQESCYSAFRTNVTHKGPAPHPFGENLSVASVKHCAMICSL